MKHTRSSAEQEIRDAVVVFIRSEMPSARIVHELNVDQGRNRIDVAAVLSDKVVAFEIKSEKDKMDRARDQMAAFSETCHVAVLVAHEKHEQEWSSRWKSWRYPENSVPWPWTLSRDLMQLRQPHAERLLGLLWAEELRKICGETLVKVPPRAKRSDMIFALAYHLSGCVIARFTCAALRERTFAEADDPLTTERPYDSVDATPHLFVGSEA